MQQLTGLDAAFLAMETRSVFGHVGSVIVLDPSTSPEPLTLPRLTSLIERRLHLIPPFRRRLAEVPLGLDQPYWIEDPDFDIEYHVREIALPEPGDDKQLAYQAARLHARALDRSRPLWELYLVHGLAGGKKAVYTKVHHAAIDGVSGNDILAAVLDLSPEGRAEEEPPPWECDEQPNPVMLLAKSAVTLARQPIRAARLGYGLARSLPGLATSPARPRLPVIDKVLRRDADLVLNTPGLRAPRTPFNRPISPHRRWSFTTVALSEVKALKNAAGCTVNDVVMALSSGALRRWLLDHDALPSSPLIAAVPVSIRTDDQKGTGGNRVSTMMAALPTHLDDPVERLRACHTAMKAAKDQHGALPADLLGDVTQFAMPAIAGQAARAAARLRVVERINPFNLIVSNVPGPPIDLYYAGCKIDAYYPLSAIADGQGLNITVCSLAGGLHFGLIADRELVPDVDRMAQYVADELAALTAAFLPDEVVLPDVEQARSKG
ncbi:MAG TPA: wax ester/triacylglycerol synthase family O-acyltransferase [Mycobacteriales bacterium]|nr:wax ester/triacylglycerol synthase family O-acyltransferase [Mycobacteriales bacterium]